MVATRHRLSVPAFFLLTLRPLAADAFQEHDTRELEVDRIAPRWESVAFASIASPDSAPNWAPGWPAGRHSTRQQAAWDAWRSQHPAWRITRESRLQRAHRAFGPGVRLPETPNQANIERLARDFLAGTFEWTGVREDELELVRAELRLGRWYIVFRQRAHGTLVWGGRADLRITAQGDVVLLGADWYPDVPAPAAPRWSGREAAVSASAGLGEAAEHPESELYLVPLPGGQPDRIRDGALLEYRLAYLQRFRTSTPVGVWLCLVDVENGDLLLRQNHARFGLVGGRIRSEIEPVTAGDPPVLRTLRDTRVVLSDGASDTSSAGGAYLIETNLPGPLGLFLELSGPFARITNASMGGATPRIEAQVTANTERDFLWDDSNSRASERDAYYFALQSHAAIKQLDPSFTALDAMMRVNVDIQGSQCNAFYDGGINFLAAGTRCVSTARIADVVHHEYGHGITDWQYRPFFPSAAMHEGFSDYWAATRTNQPTIGIGFFGPGTQLRSVANTRRSPDDLNGEPHNDGLILAAALWDLRGVLGQGKADSLFHYARYGMAEHFDDYLLDVLVTDDDNANIFDGTPHFDTISAAFRTHGIGDYSVQIRHTPLSDAEDPEMPIAIEATITSLLPLAPDSLRLVYRTDAGDWTELTLEPAAGVRAYSVPLPLQADEAVVEYFLRAADEGGQMARLPAAAPAEYFRFRIGLDTTPPEIAFDTLPDQPIDAPGWPLEVRVTDNLRPPVTARLDYSVNAETLHLGLAPPVVIGGDSTRRLFSFPTSGAVLGDRYVYRIVATDGAMTPNERRAPEMGGHEFRIVRGSWQDFEANTGGLVPTGEWEWGEPLGGVTGAASGTRVWAVRLAGTYANLANSELTLPAANLAGWQSAELSFAHWIWSEDFFDGGRLEASTDDVTWQVIEPDGGYPRPHVDVFDGPGFSGVSDAWQNVAFDLSRWLRQVVRLRLRFASDNSIAGRGWFIDDLQLVERQRLAVPLDLAATSGEDTRVSLHWRAPAGVDPSRPDQPVIGYNVYRATVPASGDAVRLNAAPEPAMSFVDPEVVNGTTYYYAVTAAYARGESPRTAPIAALPFRAAYDADTDSIHVSANQGSHAELRIGNVGTGVLRVSAWVGDESDTLDDARIAYTPSEGPTFELLHTDAEDAPGRSADLHQVMAKLENGSLFLNISGHRIWPSVSAFTIIVGLDTDLDRSTGDPEGNDFYVFMGGFPLQRRGVPAYIAEASGRIIGIPHHNVFPSNAGFVEVGFALDLIGAPSRLFAGVAALENNLATLIDRAPNAAAAAWLGSDVRQLHVAAGTSEGLEVRFATDLPPGEYRAQLLFDTNDPARPEVAIPVHYVVEPTDVEIAELTVAQERADVVVRWSAAGERNIAHYRVQRAARAAAFETLPVEIATRGDRRYEFRDASPPPGSYTYRIATQEHDGTLGVHAAQDIDVVQATPARTFLDPGVPNPFNPRTTLQYGVAAPGLVTMAIYDVRGHLVRTLIRSAHVAPGYYGCEWDGTDNNGARLATGVYQARLQAAGQIRSRRLVLIK